MSNTVYESLSEKWTAQRERYREWRHLQEGMALALKSKLTEELGVKGRVWKEGEKHTEREYVELYSLQGDQTALIGSLYDENIYEEGEVPFGVAITLEKEPNSYPKTRYKIPVAVRVKKGKSEVSFWDVEENRQERESTWTSVDVMVEGIISRLEEHLSFDPLEGGTNKRSIGFIQDVK